MDNRRTSYTDVGMMWNGCGGESCENRSHWIMEDGGMILLKRVLEGRSEVRLMKGRMNCELRFHEGRQQEDGWVINYHVHSWQSNLREGFFSRVLNAKCCTQTLWMMLHEVEPCM